MTTKVTIFNHGPDTIEVHATNPETNATTNALVTVRPGTSVDQYVYTNQVLTIVEVKPTAVQG